MYQPEPLNWMAGDEMSRSTFPLHFSHFERGESLTFWMASKRCPHLVHRYSYIGTGTDYHSGGVEAGGLRWSVACS